MPPAEQLYLHGHITFKDSVGIRLKNPVHVGKKFLAAIFSAILYCGSPYVKLRSKYFLLTLLKTYQFPYQFSPHCFWFHSECFDCRKIEDSCNHRHKVCIGIPGIRMCLDTHTILGRDSTFGKLVQSERNESKIRKIHIPFSFHIGLGLCLHFTVHF